MLTRKQLSELVKSVLQSSDLVFPDGQIDCSAEEVADTIAEWLDRAGHIRCKPEGGGQLARGEPEVG